MSKVVVFMNLTLDGVMQAPGRPDEDRRGGFEHGGWATPYATMEAARASMANTNALLLGRRTYEDFYTVWPNRTDNPFTAVLNNIQKCVASTTLSEPLPWSNSTLLKGDAAEAVARLKQEPGKEFRSNGQRSAGPVADAAQPRRRVCAADPPADPGIGAPPLPRRRCIRRAPAR